MRKVSGILADTTELRKLIMENPDLPIVVLCSEDVNIGDYAWTYASDIRFSIGEILDHNQEFNDEKVYSDRDDFEEDLREWIFDIYNDDNTPDEEVENRVEEEKAKLEPFWKKCIIISADN